MTGYRTACYSSKSTEETLEEGTKQCLERLGDERRLWIVLKVLPSLLIAGD